MQALSDAKAGENYTIKWMFGLPEVLEFLHSHHVEEGVSRGPAFAHRGRPAVYGRAGRRGFCEKLRGRCFFFHGGIAFSRRLRYNEQGVGCRCGLPMPDNAVHTVQRKDERTYDDHRRLRIADPQAGCGML